MLELDEIKPSLKPSFSEAFWKVIDEKVDEISRKAGVPKEYRGYVRDAAHALIEKGAEKALDQALYQAELSDPQKEAIKAAAQMKF